jgi:3',5'-cyclic AMP phosphodiesterase CpdA
MKLLVLSDLHLEFSDFVPPNGVDFDVAVLAGDIVCPGSKVAAWTRRALPQARAVLLVNGNHEYYDNTMPDELARIRQAATSARRPPLHVLDCQEVIIGGVRFLGCTLWTDFELRIDTDSGPQRDASRGIEAARRFMVDYRAIDVREVPPGGDVATWRKLTPEDTLRFHRAQRAWLQQALAQPFDGPTVVITHHGPHRASLAPRFAADWVSTAFISELPAHFFEVPVLWIHGHTHTSFDYRAGACRVLCNPRGYHSRGRPLPENKSFNPGLVVQV